MEPIIVKQDINKIPLVDFLAALGHKPEYAEGRNLFYKPPYESEASKPCFVVDSVSNRWRDLESRAFGGIYDLAYEMTGSCNMRELKMYILTQMEVLQVRKNDSRPERKPSSPGMKM